MSVADDTRQRLLSAAGRVFAERGFQEATVRDICRAAGANLAAVNYHFGDKERLYIESVKQAHACRLSEVPLPVWPADAPPEAKLRGFIETLLVRMLEDEETPWHTQLMMRELFQPTAACAEWVRDYIRPQFETLVSIIGELVPAETSAEKRRLLAFSVVGQCLYYKVARPIVSLLVSEDEFRTHQPARLAEHICGVMVAAARAIQPAVGTARSISAGGAGPTGDTP